MPHISQAASSSGKTPACKTPDAFCCNTGTLPRGLAADGLRPKAMNLSGLGMAVWRPSYKPCDGRRTAVWRPPDDRTATAVHPPEACKCRNTAAAGICPASVIPCSRNGHPQPITSSGPPPRNHKGPKIFRPTLGRTSEFLYICKNYENNAVACRFSLPTPKS